MKSRVIKIFLLSIVFLVAGIFYQHKNQPASAQVISPAPTCGTSPSDVVLVLDRSGSMKETISGTTGTKMAKAKNSAKRFVDILAKDTRNRVGVSSFATEARIDRTLTNNWESAKTEIGALTPEGDTCTECGIFKGNLNIKENGRTNVKKIIILLTDGKANVIQGSPNRVSTTTAENKAIAEAKIAHEAQGTIIFTIGVGDQINADFLRKMASVTGGRYYASPTSDDLNSIYDKISLIIAKGSVNGVVFNDVNKNGTLDSGETNLSGWNVELTVPGGSKKNLTSDANGAYSFTGLCDGSYSVKQTVKSGWSQTLPANNAPYTLSLTNGNSQTNKNFGNAQVPPTQGPTCTENAETITVTPDNGNGIGKPGEEVVYTVTVKNNNVNCSEVTYNLSASILNNTNNSWTYTFDRTSLSIASGQSSSTKLRVTSPPAAPNGPKTITVNVVKPGGAQKSVNTIYNVLADEPTSPPTPSCVQNTPSFLVSPTSITPDAGEEADYGIEIINNDTGSCQPRSFSLSAAFPGSGWQAFFGKDSPFELAKGAKLTTNVRIKGPSNLSSNSYKITLTLKSGSNTAGVKEVYYLVGDAPTPTFTLTPTPHSTITPTPSNTPGRTFMNLTLGIDGIGTTPRIPIGGNKNPDHSNRNLTVKLYNTSDNSKYGEYFEHTFTYNPASEKFESQLEIPFLAEGESANFNLYVQGPRYLYGQYPGSVLITRGQTLNLNSQNFYLITGNVNNTDLSENRIDLMDYNVFISCSIFSQDTSACDQDPNNASYSDLDDNGIVNEDDYTLFLKEFANQQGVILPD
ncbi:MAG: VWA domain-containing protein [Candidatus Levybacteria bacterium]|nr:VWA domain-containing protein [Candidatus Levybacteria bacterium]